MNIGGVPHIYTEHPTQQICEAMWCHALSQKVRAEFNIFNPSAEQKELLRLVELADANRAFLIENIGPTGESALLVSPKPERPAEAPRRFLGFGPIIKGEDHG